MKLWEKIFLCTLALVIAAVDITAFAILSETHRSMVERERNQAATEHQYFSAAISNKVVYERLKGDKILLGKERVQAILREQIGARAEGGGTAVYTDENTLLGAENCKPAVEDSDFREAVQQQEKCLLKVEEYGGHTYVVAGSPLELEDTVYYLFTTKDISDVYSLLDEQSSFAQTMSFVFTGIAAIVLLAVAWGLLRPLHKANFSLRSIARGNYSMRLPAKGSPEIRELSGNINRMASSIEENVEHLRSAAEERKRFIDNLAHEMKTPLTSILGFADILRVKRMVTEEERREYAGVIVEETKRLRSLSGKLMELITAGSTHLEKTQIYPAELFEEIRVAFQPILEKASIHLRYAAGEINLYADRELLKSLLYNLIDNAVKASSPGQEIYLHCEKHKDNTIAFIVEDQGIGMTREDIQKVTEPFYMVDKSRSRKAGGAGLGLSLCLEIARCHGGSLSIQSTPGKGTTVIALLPEGGNGSDEIH